MHKFFEIMKAEAAKFEAEIQEDPELSHLKAELEKYADNIPANKERRLELKYALVEALRGKERQEDALEVAMEIIKEDKAWQDKKANKLVLEIFKDLGGNKSTTVQKYRKVMQRLLS